MLRGVGERQHVLPEVDVLQVHALARLHVVVQTFVVGEEASTLGEVGSLGTGGGEGEALGEAKAGSGVFQKPQELLGNVFHAVPGVVELGAGGVRVDPLVVDLRGSVGVAVAIARHLTRPADVVVADGLPPDAGHGLLQPLDAVVHLANLHPRQRGRLGVAVPALHQVDDVEHDQEGHGDVDVAV